MAWDDMSESEKQSVRADLWACIVAAAIIGAIAFGLWCVDLPPFH